MRINRDALHQIAQSHYAQRVNAAFGKYGMEIMGNLLHTVREVYKYIAIEAINGAITIIAPVEADEIRVGRQISLSELAQVNWSNLTLQVHENYSYSLLDESSYDLSVLSMHTIVYVYEAGVERLWAGGSFETFPRLLPAYPSLFAIPTFSQLEDALEHYRTSMIRHSSCKLFNDAWSDPARIFFSHSPEAIFRNSLTQFLKISLRPDVEVRPEQVVDESHPVDIKVTWLYTNRLALIEIKWLGKSLSERGTITNNHTDYRARQGAKQLADYLDANKVQAPMQYTRGYLVIIDARRRGTSPDRTSITPQNGLYYAEREIHFDPCYHETRADFHPPLRMFAEPICI